MQGTNDATALDVYVKDHLVDTIVLFGVRKASQGTHGDKGGLTFVLDITPIIDELHLNGALNVDALDVRIVPENPVPEEANIRIGRIRVFRQCE